MLIFRDKCDISRYTAAAQAYGSKRTATPNDSDVYCMIITKSMKGFSSITGQWLVTTAYKLLFPHGTDIEEGDRITNVRWDDGTLIQDNFEVDGGVILHRGAEMRLKVANLKIVQ